MQVPVRLGILFLCLGFTMQPAKVPDALKPMDEGGFARTLASNKGKVVLIDFWASWCHGCRLEMPELIKLQERLSKNGFVLLTVSMDEPKGVAAAIQFLKEQHAPAPAYVQRAKNEDAFIHTVDKEWSGSLPATFLYGRDGRRAASFIGATDVAKIEAEVTRLR